MKGPPRLETYANAIDGARPRGGGVDPAEAAWVAERRRLRASWTAIAAMLGRPIDAVRRAYDPGFGPDAARSAGPSAGRKPEES